MRLTMPAMHYCRKMGIPGQLRCYRWRANAHAAELWHFENLEIIMAVDGRWLFGLVK